MIGTDLSRQSRKFHVSAKTKTNSARDVLVEGLRIAKQREEVAAQVLEKTIPVAVNGKEMKSPPLISRDSLLSIDPVIGRMLGGYRNGYYIQWDLTDGFTYRYDIFEHRLTRFQPEKP